jgi:hypothetical protein
VRSIGPLLAAAAVAAGCGGSLKLPAGHAGTRTLSAYGISVDLPAGWNGRIVLGASGRPVLHAASFPLSANDDDSGEIARETLGQAYVNVRNLGPGTSPHAFPVTFTPADFKPSAPTHGRQTEASRQMAASDELFRITVICGGEAPAENVIDEANSVLLGLRLEPYVAAAVRSLPPDAKRIEGYGISMRLPAGWSGGVDRGELDASSGEIRLRLLEHASDYGFVTGRAPIELTPAEFVPPSGESDPRIPASSGRSFVDHGRAFMLWVEASSFPPGEGPVNEANEALATLHVEPGDFYPGTVEPATFAQAEGWHTGTSGTTDAKPDGQQTFTWASTAPYRDEPFQFAPRKTLETLPPDGIVIAVQLFGPDEHARLATLPLRIAAAEGPSSFEGVGQRTPLYGLGGRMPGQMCGANISVFFGRPHPTPEQIAAADEELARLVLPDWSGTG